MGIRLQASGQLYQAIAVEDDASIINQESEQEIRTVYWCAEKSIHSEGPRPEVVIKSPGKISYVQSRVRRSCAAT